MADGTLKVGTITNELKDLVILLLGQSGCYC